MIVGGDFINDVTASDDGSKLYLSDNNNIYEIDVASSTYSILLANAGANGLFYDETNNRLIYTDDTPQTGSQISAIDLTTNTSTPLATNPKIRSSDGLISTSISFIFNPTISSLDGITADIQGNYYVSYWNSNNGHGIIKYDSGFATGNILPVFNDAGAGYADIYYDQTNDQLVVPKMMRNAVDFVQPNYLVNTESEISIPSTIKLHQNFPNPFNPTTTISYEINEESLVNITIYDLLGSKIVQLVNQIEQPGSKTVRWNGRDAQGNLVNGGVYVYRLNTGNYSETRKMVFLK